MTQTSLQWWEQVLADPARLTDWLQKQYHGEATAADRICEFRDQFAKSNRDRTVLTRIANEEENHAGWVAGLLKARGITPAILAKPERYWDQTLPGITDLETGAGVAAHAEHMRLERIRVIVDHPSTPGDIREVFSRILPEEIGHESAFTWLAGTEGLNRTQGQHELGLAALGLAA